MVHFLVILDSICRYELQLNYIDALNDQKHFSVLGGVSS
jgi:hypothetical protein